MAAAVDLKNNYEAANRLAKYTDYHDGPVLNKISEKIRGQFNQTRMDLLLQNNSLPSDLIASESNDDISRMAQTPKTSLSHLRELADKLGFILTPFDYLDDRSYKDEDYKVKHAISNFNAKLNPWFQTYVLSPIHFYDVQKHVASEVDLPIYANKDAAQAFMAINMAIPMFRTLSMNIDQLRDHAKNLSKVVSKNTQELANLSKRITALEAQVEAQRQQAILQERRNQEMRAQLEQLQSRREFWAYEPLLFAFSKNLTINDEGIALVGPCWGPDFKDIVFTALDLKVIKNQRANLAAKALEWAGSARSSY